MLPEEFGRERRVVARGGGARDRMYVRVSGIPVSHA